MCRQKEVIINVDSWLGRLFERTWIVVISKAGQYTYWVCEDIVTIM